MKQILPILYICSLVSIKAQNLVPDSSFEINKFIPMEFSAINASFYWNRPSLGTSDLFCKCDRKTKIATDKAYSDVDVPQNPMGNQFPHSGICYAGFYALAHGDYREYLQTPLSMPLQKNKIYRFSMQVSLADYSRLTVDQLGVCFVKKKSEYGFTEMITDLEPVYMVLGKEINKDADEWHEVTVTYTASGGENHLIIGSFIINKVGTADVDVPKDVKPRINQKIPRDAYYFVDDVSLVETALEMPAEEVENVKEETEEPVAKGTLLVLKNVLFEINEAVLLPSSYKELDLVAGYLKKDPKLQIDIYGHTDNSGTESMNKKLSAERAKAVAEYLKTQGIGERRIHHEGFGSSRPVATNDTEEGKQQNRRVEFMLR